MTRLAPLLLVLALSTCGPTLLPAAEDRPYDVPDVHEYFATLVMPDNPTVRCCGESDAYFADAVAPCAPGDVPVGGGECALVAIITDERSDTILIEQPNGVGKVINRPHLDVGTRVVIPRHKLRRKPVANPTEHTLFFVGVADGVPTAVYCYEPGALL